MTQWGTEAEPADHDFMQRLYGKWDTSEQGQLTLQNLVTGLAKLKGTMDIMNSMSLFFDLFDDERNGKVDREGILRMSESLLFLSRRGFEGALTPSPSMNGFNSPAPEPTRDLTKVTTGEKFLGSVSDFIRRCFEYADPDEPTESPSTPATENLGAFAIGDDEDDEDLLDLTERKSSSSQTPAKTKPAASDPLTASPPQGSLSASSQLYPHLSRQNSSSRAASHNLALDPNKPLHITLPTFRMVILADELLEQFFETFFPQSFHLSDTAVPGALSPQSTTLSGNLTTFTNLGTPVKNLLSSGSNKTVIDVGHAGGVVEPGSRGLRGVLDNIVNDGMRMAAEMRKRMDETQKEFEQNARQGQQYKDDEEEDEEYDEKATEITKGDQDLLDGADAASIKTIRSEDTLGRARDGSQASASSTAATLLEMPKVVEFESR